MRLQFDLGPPLVAVAVDQSGRDQGVRAAQQRTNGGCGHRASEQPESDELGLGVRGSGQDPLGRDAGVAGQAGQAGLTEAVADRIEGVVGGQEGRAQVGDGGFVQHASSLARRRGSSDRASAASTPNSV